MAKIIYATLWCIAVVFFLLITGSILATKYMPSSWGFGDDLILSEVTQASDEAKLADEESTRSALAQTADARAVLVANFIERNDAGHNSPLQPYGYWGEFFVSVADEYGLDFRLLPAIARKESTFCKSNIAQKYYNCFGYGVPASGITEAGKFESYEQGIRTVAASLKKSYIDKGLTDPIAIMSKYCPPSAEGAGAWARNINQWMGEMRYDDKTMGLNSTENADLTEFVAAPSAGEQTGDETKND